MKTEHKIFERPESTKLLIDEGESENSIIIIDAKKTKPTRQLVLGDEDEANFQRSVVSIKDKINKLSSNLITYNKQVRDVLDNIPQSVGSETDEDFMKDGSRVVTLGKISQLSIMRDDDESEMSRLNGSKI